MKWIYICKSWIERETRNKSSKVQKVQFSNDLTSHSRKTRSFPAKAIGKWIDIYWHIYTEIQDNCKMSSYPAEQSTISNINDVEHRTQTDSVHERFCSNFYVYCDDCKSKIEPNKAAIEKHYKSELHPSNKICRYCKGKVFIYRNIVNGVHDAKSYTFHKCKHERLPEEESAVDKSLWISL